RARRNPLGDRAEIGREPALVVLRNGLISEHQDRVPVPGLLDLPDRLRIEGMAEIDTANLGPNDWMQLGARDPAGRFCNRHLPSLASLDLEGRLSGRLVCARRA